MSLNKRISGDFTIESVESTDAVVIKSQDIRIQGLDRYTDEPDDDGVPNFANTVTIDGNLVVTGDTMTVTSTNTEVVDAFMVLNSGEGASATGITSIIPGFDGATGAGVIIERGSILDDVALRYNEDLDRWEATDDGTVWFALNNPTIGMTELLSDLTPQLGGPLDVNGFAITSATDGDVVIVADGTGLVKIDQDLSLLEQGTDETPLAGYNKVYAKAPSIGGTGLYVANTTSIDELVSKRKAIVFSIIF